MIIDGRNNFGKQLLIDCRGRTKYSFAMRNRINQKEKLMFNSKVTFDYEPVNESIYTFEHPLVIKQTDQFINKTKDKEIFKPINAIKNKNKKKTALVVSECWHRFSELMPVLLCYAAYKVKSNLLRHYIIQVPFEELGMRNANEIHHVLFADAQKLMNIGRVKVKNKIKSLVFLEKSFHQNDDDDNYTLGLLLGLEIPGQENIKTILDCMSFDELVAKRLSKTKFFQIHQSIEIEHIRLNTSNFLRFCKKREQKKEFMRGFENGLLFWEKFWLEVALLCE